MRHIRDNETTAAECIFEIGRGKSYDKDGLLLYRQAEVVVLLNRFPYANGHLLVAPGRHTADIADLLPGESQALFAMLQKSVAILRKYYNPDGFNLGLNLGEVAGAGQPDHLHFHIVPRWHGDHNFMATVAEIRTIPEHIEHTFDQLLPDFQELLAIQKNSMLSSDKCD